MDITNAGIEWCRSKYTPLLSNFKFQQIDVYNKWYNPKGSMLPSSYKFPFDQNSFTFVMLGSVFTYMLPDDATNYLSEIHRVMKIGGRCLITYFLLNDESLALIKEGKATQDFQHQNGVYRTISTEFPELAIAFDEDWVKSIYEKVGLKIVRTEHGSWCGRKQHYSYQDMILAVKES